VASAAGRPTSNVELRKDTTELDGGPDWLLVAQQSRAVLLGLTIAGVALLSLSIPFRIMAQTYGNTLCATLLFFVGLAIELWRLTKTNGAFRTNRYLTASSVDAGSLQQGRAICKSPPTAVLETAATWGKPA
jgi:hypothetical protein